MRPTPACGGGLSRTCSAGSGAAEAFIVEQSHQSHQDGTIGTEGHSLLAREDDWGFSGSIRVGWKLFLAQESRISERARRAWDTGNYLCVWKGME